MKVGSTQLTKRQSEHERKKLLRVGGGGEGDGEDAQHGENHRRQEDELALRLAVSEDAVGIRVFLGEEHACHR